MFSGGQIPASGAKPYPASGYTAQNKIRNSNPARCQINAIDLTRLSGLLEIGSRPTPEHVRRECKRLREAGFEDAYPGDLFLEFLPEPARADRERIVFQESGGTLCFRRDSIYAMVKEVVREEGLTMQSAHYNQMLSPPNTYPAKWLFDYHGRMLEIASQMGLQRVTTHPGWMFGSAMEIYTGEAARKFSKKEISMTQLNRVAFETYGGDEKVWEDSVGLYRWLCKRAKTCGITITMETAISEWYDLTLDPERMVRFCSDVGASNLGICVDSGHCNLNGLATADVIRACGNLVLETHFHDNYGQRDEHNPLGEGSVDWPSVIQALLAIQYRGVVTFEQQDHQTNATRWRDFLSS